MKQLPCQIPFAMLVAIRLVANNWVPQELGVHTNLVCATCFEFEFAKCVVAENFHHFKVCDGISSVSHNVHFFSVGFATANGLVHHTAVLLQHAFQKGVVDAPALFCLNLLLQVDVGSIVFGNDKQSACVLVQPVHDSGAQNAVDAGQILDVEQQCVDQRVLVDIVCGVHSHALRFVDYNQTFVLVHNVQGDVLRRQVQRNFVGQYCHHAIANFGTLRRLCANFLVDAHGTAVNQLLCVATCQTGVFGNANVQPFVVAFAKKINFPHGCSPNFALVVFATFLP